MSTWAKNIINKTTQSRSKIESFTKIEDMPLGEPWDGIKELYHSKSQQSRFLATVLNGLATEGKTSFFMSKKIFSDMLKIDPNIDRGPVNMGEFNSFMKIYQTQGIFGCETKPTSFDEKISVKARRAGKYKIMSNDILNHLTKEASESSDSPSCETSPATSPEYENEVEIKSETEFVNENIYSRDRLNNDGEHGIVFSINGFFDIVADLGPESENAKLYFTRWVKQPSRFGFPIERVKSRLHIVAQNQEAAKQLDKVYDDLYKDSQFHK